MYRVKVVTAMLKAGVPLTKIDSFRDLLEENGYALTNSSNLRQLVPFILEEEIALLKQEIGGKHVSIMERLMSAKPWLLCRRLYWMSFQRPGLDCLHIVQSHDFSGEIKQAFPLHLTLLLGGGAGSKCCISCTIHLETLLAFKAAQYFSPSKLHELKPTANELDSLQAFPFFDHEIIGGLKSELPLYLASAEDVSDQVDAVGWWKVHHGQVRSN